MTVSIYNVKLLINFSQTHYTIPLMLGILHLTVSFYCPCDTIPNLRVTVAAVEEALKLQYTSMKRHLLGK